MGINVSDRKLAANRANAQKSTGPRSDSGKRIASMNRLEHGFRSEEVILPFLGETVEEFEAFYTAIMDELNPQNSVQLNYAQDFIKSQWRLRRSIRAETGYFRDVASNLYYSHMFQPKQPGQKPTSFWDETENRHFYVRAQGFASQLAKQTRGDDFLTRLSRYEHGIRSAADRSYRRFQTVPIVEPLGDPEPIAPGPNSEMLVPGEPSTPPSSPSEPEISPNEPKGPLESTPPPTGA